MRRVFLFVIAALALTACDGYIEEARVQRDGTVEFAARATVVCTDELQQAIWGGDPCDVIDDAIRTGEIGDLPFDFDLDPNRVSLVGTGEADRRVVDALWSGTATELSSVLVSGGEISILDELRTEAVFTPADTPATALETSTDPEIVEQLRFSRWEPAEFRITAPDLIVEHNGDKIQGRVVVWYMDGAVPDEFRVVWTTETPPLRWWWWVVGSSILMIVLFMMITIEGPAQAKANAAERAAKRAAEERAEAETVEATEPDALDADD